MFRNYLLALGLTIISCTSLIAQQSAIISQLNALIPDAEINILKADDHFVQEYEIMIPQMVDHKDPKAGFFNQRIFLSHYNIDSPILMVTEGYAARDRTYEIAKELKTNQITVEYRFFGKSVPEKIDWDYLTNEQAMKDLHHIHRVFSKFYKNKNWITTGISKGGTTCMFYKATYPKDSRIAIPYVGPMPVAPNDKRCDDHLKSVGTPECRNALSDFQKRALDQKAFIIPKIDSLAKANNLSFSMGTDKALEYSVLELTFSFWQYAHDCEAVPSNSSPEQSFQYLLGIVGFDFYSDKVIELYKPAFYQFVTQNGYYAFVHEHLKDRLVALTQYDNSPFAPQEANLVYDPSFMKKSLKKLQKKRRILQVQGQLDPWAACGEELKGKDQFYFEKEGGGHTTRISSFSDKQQEEIWSIVESWMK